MPFGDFSGTSGTTTTTAKLDLDINDVQVSKLQQVANLSNVIAANASAMARFTADYVKYLQQIPALQREMNANPVTTSAGNGTGLGAGALGLVAGIQSQAMPSSSGDDRTSPPAPASTPAAQAANSATLASMSTAQLAEYNDQLSAVTPSSYSRSLAQGQNAGAIRPAILPTRNQAAPPASSPAPAGEPERRPRGAGNGASPTRSEPEGTPFDRMTEYLERFTRIGGGVQTALTGGQMGQGLVRLQQALNFGSLAKLAPVVGTAAAGYEAYHFTNEQANESNELGRIRGQGAISGIGYQAQISQMALNPFLTNEQSRQIVMAGLQEGYSGKEFDSVTKFMATNLSSMNISVADSVKLLQSNVEEGRQSINSLGSQLSTLKGMAPNSNTSLEDMSNSFVTTSTALVSAGSSGMKAGQAATLASGLFQNKVGGDTNPLKSMGGAIVTAGVSSTSALNQIGTMNHIAGGPNAVATQLQGSQMVQAQMQLITQMASRFNVGAPDNPVAAITDFQNWFNATFGLNWTYPQAEELYTQALSKNGLYQPAQSYVSQNNGSKITAKTPSRFAGGITQYLTNGTASDPFNLTGSKYDAKSDLDTAKQFGFDFLGAITKGDKGISQYFEDKGSAAGKAYDQNTVDKALATSSIGDLSGLKNQYDAAGGNLYYIDSNNKRQKFTSSVASNKSLLDNIYSGQYKLVQGNSNNAKTLTDLISNGGFTTAENTAGATVSGELQISLTAKAQELLGLSSNPVKLSPNQKKAGSGQDGATFNSEPMGGSN